jgi:L-ascorbate metabolism protein UlaG (beta-lactamase superfamily)
MKIKFLGHSCFQIELGGKTLLFDPFISSNPKASSIDVSSLRPDYILLTHGHEDHVADAEKIARQSDATMISSFEVASWYGSKGLKNHPMNLGGKWKFDFGTVKYVQAVHSSVLPDGTHGGPSGGFVIWNEENCFYFAGDTALTMDMKLIPMLCPKLDFAILPIGDNFTMGFEDAAIAADFIQCNHVIGAHFDTFGYVEINHDAAIGHFKNNIKKLTIMNIGEEINI